MTRQAIWQYLGLDAGHWPMDAETEAQLTQALGRTPQGAQAVRIKDGKGQPVVVQVQPLVDDKPFPTFYWLCCRRLIRAISHLEAAGLIKTLEARLQADPELMAQHHASHQDYVTQRDAAMTETQRQRIAELGFTQVFQRRGVGGIDNWDQVRCLHTHYAHHLCGNNLVGQLLDTEYGLFEQLD